MGSSGSVLKRRKLATQIPRRTTVSEITTVALGRFLVDKCGNEGQHRYLDETGQATLEFLRASIDFVPQALQAGANMRNTSFIYAQPGREFVISAGNGDWEFYFSQTGDEINCQCVRKPMYRYVWDGIKWLVVRTFAPIVTLALAAP
ncbi:hypothetical protein ACROYT_G029042 [Oculina patagonica]